MAPNIPSRGEWLMVGTWGMGRWALGLWQGVMRSDGQVGIRAVAGGNEGLMVGTWRWTGWH